MLAFLSHHPGGLLMTLGFLLGFSVSGLMHAICEQIEDARATRFMAEHFKDKP
jgi:hypothetical protein